ncbi:unnamed protein product, partial [marine sediment metagenome]
LAFNRNGREKGNTREHLMLSKNLPYYIIHLPCQPVTCAKINCRFEGI